MQDVIQHGVDYIYCRHEDNLDLTGLYSPSLFSIEGPNGAVDAPGYDIVQTPRDFIYAFDASNKRLDPRRFAGEGGTILFPASSVTLTGTDSVATTSAPMLQLGTPGAGGAKAAWVSVAGNVLSIKPAAGAAVTYAVASYPHVADLQAAINASGACLCLMLSTGSQPLVLADLAQTAFP